MEGERRGKEGEIKGGKSGETGGNIKEADETNSGRGSGGVQEIGSIIALVPGCVSPWFPFTTLVYVSQLGLYRPHTSANLSLISSSGPWLRRSSLLSGSTFFSHQSAPPRRLII